MALLELKELSTEIALSKSTVYALDRLTVDLAAGETLGIVGESGCGKTMTAMSIEQLLPPGGYIANGEVNFDGRNLVGMAASELRKLRGSDIGMIFQDPSTSLNPVKRVGDQVAEPLLLHSKISKAAARKQVVDMFQLVGIPSPARRFNDYPHQLSGGQRQRVMIAMALICRPKLLIADEPTTALDVTIQKQILDLVDSLRAELNMAMILVTHDLGVIAGRADRVAVMYAGRIVELADTTELFARPRHRYTQALFEALPERVAGTAERLYSIPGLPPDLTAPPSGCRFAARCRFADDECRTQDPVLEDHSDGGPTHAHACFHPVSDAELAESARALETTLHADAATSPAGAGAAIVTDADGGAEADGDADLSADVGADADGADGAAQRPTGGAHAAGTSPAGIPPATTSTDDRTWVAPTTMIPEDGVPLVQMKDLVKDFPVTGGFLQRKIGAVSAVAHVDLTIERGQTLGLVGESGCGKTTLGRLVVGLDAPTGGEILFRGRRIDRMRGAKRRLEQRNVQLMFQDSFASLDPRMRVRSILKEPLAIQHVGNARDRDERVDELLEAVGLPKRAGERYPHEFSGGQRQRIGLARALALQPGLIVADEPVSALDVSIQAQILNLMKELQRERQLTYMFISHDLSVIRYLSDVIAVMYLGKIVEVGPADQVYANSQHPYTRGLIATIPVADPAIEHAKQRGGVAGELPSALNPPSGCRFRTRCPYAQDICAEEEPILRIAREAVGADEAAPRSAVDGRGRPLRSHEVACHFPLVAQGWTPSDELSTAPSVRDVPVTAGMESEPAE